MSRRARRPCLKGTKESRVSRFWQGPGKVLGRSWEGPPNLLVVGVVGVGRRLSSREWFLK
jgi:hypothetical protein